MTSESLQRIELLLEQVLAVQQETLKALRSLADSASRAEKRKSGSNRPTDGQPSPTALMAMNLIANPDIGWNITKISKAVNRSRDYIRSSVEFEPVREMAKRLEPAKFQDRAVRPKKGVVANGAADGVYHDDIDSIDARLDGENRRVRA